MSTLVPPAPPPDSQALELVGEVLRVLQAFGVVPVWGIVLGAVLTAVAVVLLRHLGLGALLGKAWTYLRSLPAPEHTPGENASPPMDMPEGGRPNPPPTREDFDP